jgi:hypothetical protein
MGFGIMGLLRFTRFHALCCTAADALEKSLGVAIDTPWASHAI